jgi:predicted nucleic acid-binding protein
MMVIDASVIVELVAFDLDPAVLGDDSLAAPHLIDNEVLESLHGLTLGGHLTDAAAATALNTFEALFIERHPSAPLRGRMWELRHNLTAYDSNYVALAERLDVPLLTKDSHMARAPGIRCHVEVL